jgi:hypothetical protein
VSFFEATKVKLATPRESVTIEKLENTPGPEGEEKTTTNASAAGVEVADETFVTVMVTWVLLPVWTVVSAGTATTLMAYVTVVAGRSETVADAEVEVYPARVTVATMRVEFAVVRVEGALNITVVKPSAFVKGGVVVDNEPRPFWTRVTAAFARGEPAAVTTVMVKASEPPALSREFDGLMDADIRAELGLV